jgi:hypothetical protein
MPWSLPRSRGFRGHVVALNLRGHPQGLVRVEPGLRLCLVRSLVVARLLGREP